MPSETASPGRRALFSAIRMLVGLAFAGALITMTIRSTGADVLGELRAGSAPLLGLATCVYGGIVFLTVVRWRLLLRVDLGIGVLCRLTLIGVFFNLAIPGAVSGDFLKMAYAAKRAPNRAAEAVLTIMLDRVMGLLGLFVVAGVMVVVCLGWILGLSGEFRVLQAGIFAVGLGSFGGALGALLIEFRERLIRIRVVSWGIDMGRRWLPAAVTHIIARFVTALDLYRHHRRTVLQALLISIVIHTGLGLNLYCVGRALHVEQLRARDYLLATQVANTVASVPVTPGGLGTRDATVAFCFKALGANAEKTGAIPLVFSLIIAFWGIVGAGVFIATPRHTDNAPGAPRRVNPGEDDSTPAGQ